MEEEENPEWVPPEENALIETQEEALEESSPEDAAGKDIEEEEIPEYLFKLFIADRGNSRVVVWNELPISQNEEDEDEGDYIEIEDDNLLIGEDDDDDYATDEEDEDGSTEELPSV